MQNNRTRRRFLQVAGLGSIGIAGCTSFGSDDDDDEKPTSELSTLIATWRGHDPTSTVTVQWLAAEDDRPDPVPVGISTENDEFDSTVRTDVTPFGESTLVRHRAILTDLSVLLLDSNHTTDVVGAQTDGSRTPCPSVPTAITS